MEIVASGGEWGGKGMSDNDEKKRNVMEMNALSILTDNEHCEGNRGGLATLC